MIVLDQVHKLSSLVRLFIIMSHVNKPLPAVVGHHKVRPGPQCAQEFPVVTTAQTWALQQHTAPPSWSSVTTAKGGKGTSKGQQTPWS